MTSKYNVGKNTPEHRRARLTPERMAKLIAGRLAVIPPLEVRFFSKVDKNGPVFADLGPCWLWTGSKIALGYGQIWDNRTRKVLHSHRVSLELAGRPVPPDMHVDHLCKNPPCVNPDHLRIVTPRINGIENNDSPLAANARKTQCCHGHPFSRENTAIFMQNGRGYRGNRRRRPARVCLTCYPHMWPWAVVERPPNPRATKHKKWLGPVAPFERFSVIAQGLES